jgi:hypothetical protein
VEPCGSYTFGMPSGHGRATVSVAITGGAQVTTLQY